MKKNRGNQILVAAFCLFLTAFLVAFFVTPKVDFSEKEKKVLSTMPKLTAQSLTDGSFFSGLDTYLSDHFPLREMWVGAAAYGSLLTGRNGANGIYLGRDGYLLPAPFEKDTMQLQKNLMFLQNFCDTTQAEVYFMPVPSAGYVLEDRLPRQHFAYEDDFVYDALQTTLADSGTLVDLRPAFSEAARTSQLFYKTDHHWTSDGAFLAYQTFLKTALPNAVSADESAYTKEEITDFYGTSYSKSGYWLTASDTITLWQHPDMQEVTIEILDDDIGVSTNTNDFFDRSYAAQSDKYPVFLGGNHSYVKISNPAAQTTRKILLIKDSFANAFAPFLAEQYSEIHLIDLRYSRQRSVTQFAAQEAIDTVLFLYSTDDFTNDNNFMWLRQQ